MDNRQRILARIVAILCIVFAAGRIVLSLLVKYLGNAAVFAFSAGSSSVGIIGGADGPTAIYVTSSVSPGGMWVVSILIIAASIYVLVRTKKAE